jgi:hypothetical protein
MFPMILTAALMVNATTLLQGAAPGASDAAPPSRARSEERWSVDYQPGPFRLYRAKDDQLYWYATFTLVNRTGKERRLAPRWELLDGAGRITRAGAGVDSTVTRAILRMMNDPSIEEVSDIIGEIGQGEASARTGIVVFAAGPESRQLSLLVAGLSNERSSMRDPGSGQQTPLRKTLRIDYVVPGERSGVKSELPLAEPPSGQKNPSWVMR